MAQAQRKIALHEMGDHILRVMIVDDDPALARTLGWMVELIGHDVKVVNDAEKALELAKTFLPEVALLDIGLSGMNGYDLAHLLREDPALASCILIAQTGWGQEEHRMRSKASGFAHHLVKPVTMETLEELFATLA